MRATHPLSSLVLILLLVIFGAGHLVQASDSRQLLSAPTASRDNTDSDQSPVRTPAPLPQTRTPLPNQNNRTGPAGKPARPPMTREPGGVQIGTPGVMKKPGSPGFPGTMNTTAPGSNTLLANTPKIAMMPKLEVKQFSGDFAQWTTDMVVSKSYVDKTFRWSANNSGWTPDAILYHIYQSSNCQGTPKQTRAIPQDQINAQGGMFEMNLNSFVHTGNYIMSVCLGLYNSDKALMGGMSNPVNISLKIPDNSTQQIQVDTLGILSAGTTATNLDGQSMFSPGYKDNNSLAIHYQYHLQSTDSAVVTAELIGQSGLLAIGNGFLIDTIQQGTSQGSTRATIKCNSTQHSSTVITGVRLLMNDGDAELADTQIALPAPVTFHCNKSDNLDSIVIQSISPPPGSIIPRLNQGNKTLTAANAITIDYQYHLESQPDGMITQYALMQSGDKHPYNFWYPHLIQSTGNGTGTTRLAVLCMGETTGPKTIHGIEIVLWGSDKYTGKRSRMMSYTFPVEYTFNCRDSVVGKIKSPMSGNADPASKPVKPALQQKQPAPGGFVGQ